MSPNGIRHHSFPIERQAVPTTMLLTQSNVIPICSYVRYLGKTVALGGGGSTRSEKPTTSTHDGAEDTKVGVRSRKSVFGRINCL